MGTYSIKELEKLSGIKAHTIRVWEQRYGLICPQRTNTNIRIYDDSQLKRLLNVSLLINNGYKISKVSKLARQEMNTLLQDLYSETNQSLINKSTEVQINALIIAMIDLDEEKFDKVFSNNILRIGFEPTITTIIYPFLEKVGLMWGIDEINPAQEHFISSLIRQKIIVAVDGLPIPAKDQEKFMLFLPENELHEIGLLLSNFLLKAHNKQVFYLGQNVPFSDLIAVADICHPDYLVTFLITTTPQREMESYIGRLSGAFPNKTILVSGDKCILDQIKKPENVAWLTSVSCLERYY